MIYNKDYILIIYIVKFATPLRATRGVAFYLVAFAFTCRVCSAYSCNSLYLVMGGGQSTAYSSTICFYYTIIFFFCQVFYTIFLELFFIYFPFAQLLHISEIFSSLFFFSVTGLLSLTVLGFTGLVLFFGLTAFLAAA